MFEINTVCEVADLHYKITRVNRLFLPDTVHCRPASEQSSGLDTGFISRMKHGVSVSDVCICCGM